MTDPLITIRLPLSSWSGITNGIEKWTHKSRFDPEVEILADYEVLDPPEYAQWDREIRKSATLKEIEDAE